MDSKKFVKAIEDGVISSTILVMRQILEKPPGRSPDQGIVAMSDWYKALEDDEKNMVMATISKAVNSTVFGLFCVLDGERVIEDGPNKGDLKIFYEKGDELTWLNDPNDGGILHELLGRPQT
jgi:hypothetical protein